jgi:potassium voltage-gated channel Eag-related subfamily H member 2
MKQSIDDFIKHHRISKPLAKQMQESFDHEWKNTKGIDMNSILKTFPECIQADICLHLNRELLNNCPVFEDASEGNRRPLFTSDHISFYFYLVMAVTLRALALLFKSTHVPPGDILIHAGDLLHSIYFIRAGHMEVLQNNESQVILSRNDIMGENPCNTVKPGKSRCVVRGLFFDVLLHFFIHSTLGLTYCTLNKIHRADLLHVLHLYPDFAPSFIARFRVTFDLRQVRPFDRGRPHLSSLVRTTRNETVLQTG